MGKGGEVKAALILIVLCAFTGIGPASAEENPLPSEELKTAFIKKGAESCIAKQKQAPVSSLFSDEQNSQYCFCVMTRSMDLITLEDMARVAETHNFTALRPIAEIAGNYCSQMLMRKWGYIKN